MRDVDDVLALLGGLVLGVLAQVAQLARALNLLREIDLQLALEHGDFVVESLENPLFHRPESDCSTVCYARPRRLSADRRSAGRMRPCAPSRAATIPSSRAFRALAATPDPTGRRVLLDGAHLVREALDAGLGFEVVPSPRRALAGRPKRAGWRASSTARASTVVEADDRAFDAVSPVRTPSGIVAIALRTASRRRRRSASVADAFVLASPTCRIPGNVGALLRVGRSRRRDRRLRQRRVGQSVFVEGAARQHGQRAAAAGRHRPAAGPHHARRCAQAGMRTVAVGGARRRRSGRASTGGPRRPVARRRRPGLADEIVAALRRRVDDPDGAAGGVAQRRGGGRAPRLRRAAATRHERLCSAIPRTRAPRAGARRAAPARRWPSACARARSTRSSARSTSWRPARRCARPSSATSLQSIILWGPPGTGKTTLARVIAELTQARFVPFSAVLAGIKEIKEVMARGRGSPAPHRPAHHRVRRRDPPLQQGAAGRLPAARRSRRHHAHRRHHREPVVRGQRGAAVALEGLRAARR